MSSPDAIRGGVKPRVGLSIVQLLGCGCDIQWTIHIASRPFRFDPTTVVLLDTRPFSFDRMDAILLDDMDQQQSRKLVITTLSGDHLYRPFSFDRMDAILLDDVDQPQCRKLYTTLVSNFELKLKSRLKP
uniref:Uncharacterized protein n=1 Tax=Oryza sativa subsp. japonica TaxID=39947 RepID=Q5Z5L5_ORYSJ|nr:hypothetical protein [Oryza sativa Japonica Group]